MQIVVGSIIESEHGIGYVKSENRMLALCEYVKQEDKPMKKDLLEKELLAQIAKILMNESIIMPEEQIRFLNILNEED